MSARISIQKLSVVYSFRAPDHDTIQRKLIGLIYPKSKPNTNYPREILALKNISLEINEGDRLGLVGANGSGKSTLLRLIAQVIYPTRGSLSITGKVNAIFDPAVGMDAEASGFENIYIRCMILHVPKDQINQKKMEIADFSELGEALYRPVKTYSTGMVMKLAFSIATVIEPEILIMDEWLSTGDAGFVAKAQKKMEELIHASRILVLASHSEAILKQWCNRLVWLKNGEIMDDGDPLSVFKKYSDHNEQVCSEHPTTTTVQAEEAALL